MRHLLFKFSILISFSLFCCSFAYASTTYKGKAPAWLERQETPEINKNSQSQISGGLYYLLVDNQIRWQADIQIAYQRVSYIIVDRLGLESGARITVEFDPSHEKIKFHSVSIQRKDETLDRFNQAEIKVYQRERELDNGIVDGHLTAHINILDVRVGDIIEYEYSVYTKPELSFREFSADVQMQWSVPVGYYRYKLILPKNKQLNIRKFGIKQSHKQYTNSDETIYEWILRDPAPIKIENYVPKWHLSGTVLLSTFNSWAEVAKGLLPYYELSDELSPDFSKKIDEIAQTFSKRTDQITQALRLVQNSIRYVGIEIGPGAFIPRKPNTTIQRGYGDCKDKTMLLLTILKRLGIEAKPALVHTNKTMGLNNRLPSLSSFNHVIVRIDHKGKVYWLDPTWSHQGGRFPNIEEPNYGYALPIDSGTKSLEKMLLKLPANPTTKITETFAFPPTPEEKLNIHIRTVYKGADADSMRFRLASQSQTELQQRYLDFYNKLYPGIKLIAPIELQDDLEKNEVVVEEIYGLGWKKLTKDNLGKNFPVSASIVNEVLKKINPSERTLPITQSFPVYRQHKINVLGLKALFSPAQKIEIENEELGFYLDSKSYKNSIHFDWRLKTKVNHVKAIKANDYASIVNRVSNATYITYNFLYEAPYNFFESEYASDTGEALILLILVFLLYLIGRFFLKKDQEYAEKGYFYPVSLTKFITINIITLSAYSYFWLWKHWYWKQKYDGAKIWPFWRSFFSFIWLYPAYHTAKKKLNGQSISPILGICAAIIYLVMKFGENLISNEMIGLALLLTSPICFFPLVLLVNKLNVSEPIALRKNSKFNKWNIFGIIVWVIIGLIFLGIKLDVHTVINI